MVRERWDALVNVSYFSVSKIIKAKNKWLDLILIDDRL